MIPIPKTQPRLTFDEKEDILLHLLWFPKLFAEAKRQLKVEHFYADERHYALLWKTLLELSDVSGGQLVTKGLKRRLIAAINTKLENYPDCITAEQRNDLIDGPSNFIEWAFNQTELYEQDGRVLLCALLRERTVIDPLKQYFLNSGDQNPTDLKQVLNEAAKQETKIVSVAANPIIQACPDGWKPKKYELTPTNISFLDKYLGGGTAPGDAVGILGPTGVGKSTLAVMIAVEAAFYQQMLTDTEDKELGHVYLFSYEAPIDPEVQLRTLSYAAQIHRDTLFTDAEFSTKGNLKQYEKKLWADNLKAGMDVPGEKERIDAVSSKLRRNLWLCEFSGALANSPYIGSGGPQEIVDYLSMERDAGKKICCVIIDYVGLAARRQMANDGVSVNEIRHFIGGYADVARRLIAENFGACVWLIHQLTGAANNSAPTVKQTHASAAEAKNWAENLHFNFSLGTKYKANGVDLCLFNCSKARRTSGGDDATILVIDGGLCALRPGDKLYGLEGNRIVPKEYQDRVVGNTEIKRSRPSPASAAGYFR